MGRGRTDVGSLAMAALCAGQFDGLAALGRFDDGEGDRECVARFVGRGTLLPLPFTGSYESIELPAEADRHPVLRALDDLPDVTRRGAGNIQLSRSTWCEPSWTIGAVLHETLDPGGVIDIVLREGFVEHRDACDEGLSIRPSSTHPRMVCTRGENRFLKPTCRIWPVRSTAATTSLASSRRVAIGFSHKTFRPASTAWTASFQVTCGGVAMISASGDA